MPFLWDFRQPQPAQAAHLRRCLNNDLKSTLIHSMGVTLDSVMPLIDMLVLTDSLMRRQHNLTLRCQQYYQCHQQSGQTPKVCTVPSVSTRCGTLLTRLLDSVIAGLCDRELTKLMNPLPHLSKSESSVEATSLLKNQMLSSLQFQHIKVSTKQFQKAQMSSHIMHTIEDRSISRKRYQEFRHQFSIVRCGDKANNMTIKCRAAGKKCKSCHKIGHYSTVCFKTLFSKNKIKTFQWES